MDINETFDLQFEYFNSSNPNEEIPALPTALITLEQYNLGFTIMTAFRLIISIIGVITNALCLRTFYRTGLDDSVTIAFFFQALFDFCHLVFAFAHAVASVIELLEKDLQFWLVLHPRSVRILINTIIRFFIEPSYLLTTFLAIQRCLCVVMPLHFKGMFTKKRTYIILTPISLLAVVPYTLILSQYELRPVTLPPFNLTRYIIFYKPDTASYTSVTYTLFGIIGNAMCQFIVTVCVFFMERVLSQSVRFRQQSSSANVPSSITANANTHESVDNDKQNDFGKNDTNYGNPNQVRKGTTMTNSKSSVLKNTKETLVIQQIYLVCMIYLVCNTPRLIGAFCRLLFPEFDMGSQYMLTFFLYYYFMMTFEHINASFNFFIYYKYNSKFRKSCFSSKTCK